MILKENSCSSVQIELVEGRDFLEIKLSRKISWKPIIFVLLLLIASLLIKAFVLLVVIVVVCLVALENIVVQEKLLVINKVGIQSFILKGSGRTRKQAIHWKQITDVFINEVLVCCDVKFVVQILHNIIDEERFEEVCVPFQNWSIPLETLSEIRERLPTVHRTPSSIDELNTGVTNDVPKRNDDDLFMGTSSMKRYNLRTRIQK